MKTIALIDTRLEVPGVSLGILVSTHPNVMAAFAANDAFLHHAAHKIRGINLVDTITELAVETVGIEQREEKLEVPLLSAVWSGGHQQEMSGVEVIC